MSRPNRPTTSIMTLGLHTLQFTWCTICHAIIRVDLLGAQDADGRTRKGMEQVEDLHYDWHEKRGES